VYNEEYRIKDAFPLCVRVSFMALSFGLKLKYYKNIIDIFRKTILITWYLIKNGKFK
jgi:hypothetical protein